MTASALTRPGERDRISTKLLEIDWRLAILLCAIAGIGTMMLYSISNSSWEPWADRHLIVFGVCFVIMLILALVDLRVWFFAAYPLYVFGLLLLVAVLLFGHSALGAARWLKLGPVQIQPSEIMKIALVLALARFYHGLPAKDARLSWKLLIPAAMIGLPVLLVAKQPDLGTAVLIAMTGASVMFLAGLSWRVLAVGAIGAVAGIPPVGGRSLAVGGRMMMGVRD